MLRSVLENVLEGEHWRIFQGYMEASCELTWEYIVMHVGVYYQVQLQVYLRACLGVYLIAF